VIQADALAGMVGHVHLGDPFPARRSCGLRRDPGPESGEFEIDVHEGNRDLGTALQRERSLGVDLDRVWPLGDLPDRPTLDGHDAGAGRLRVRRMGEDDSECTQEGTGGKDETANASSSH
jgi:hypothetical protein